MPSTLEATRRSRPEGSYYASVTVPNRVESIRLAADFIVQAARTMRVTPASDSLFELAIVEALNNAFCHGQPARCADAAIVCELELMDRRLTVRILSSGPGFVLPPTPGPDWRADDITAVPEGGFGLAIIRGVFPRVRTIARPGEFGLEMALTF